MSDTTRQPHSTHIFMFPFRFDLLKTRKRKFKNEFELYRAIPVSDRTDMQILHNALENNGWKYDPFKIDFSSNKHAYLHYNDFAYFYDYVREVLYNLNETPQSNDISRFYRKKNFENASYIIGIDKFSKQYSYCLDIEGVTLRIFSTGVGILSLELHNYQYEALEDVLRINDYGRRIYPQFISKADDEMHSLDVVKDSFLPGRVAIEVNGESFVAETFTDQSFTDVRIGKHIMKILGDDLFIQELSDVISDYNTPKIRYLVQPSLDDRMFVHSWYGKDCIAAKIMKHNADSHDVYLNNDDWYRMVFVDNGDATVKNKGMKHRLLSRATYDRWSDYNTLYGLTRYSFVCLTSSYQTLQKNYADYIPNHVNTMYFQMSSLLLAVRTSILRFSDEIAAIAHLQSIRDEERLHDLYKRYLSFYNRLYFREVTHQDQGIELYDIGLKQMKIVDHMRKLDNKFTKLHDFAQLKTSSRESHAMNGLSLIATVLGIPALVIAIFSIGVFDFDKSWNNLFSALGMAVLSSVIGYAAVRRWLDRHNIKE